MTDLLFLREPQRRQALARVVARRGPAFLLDCSIFYATSHLYRHPQPADRGEMWIGGDKRVLTRVHWRRGELLHQVRGVTPPSGTQVNCHLDGERRDDASAAHTAMHMVVSAFVRLRFGTLTAEPQVVGGRQFSLTGRFDASGPSLHRLLEAANGSAARSIEVTAEYRPRGSVRDVDVQPFEDRWSAPEEPSLRLVRIGEASLLPCDGTFVNRAARLGRITVAAAWVGRSGARVLFRVARPATRNPWQGL